MAQRRRGGRRAGGPRSKAPGQGVQIGGLSSGPRGTGSDPRAALAKAEAALRGGRLDEAEAVCRRLLAVDARQPAALHLIGIAQLQAGRLAAAVEHLQQAAAVSRRNPDVHCNLASALLGLDRVAEGRAALERAVALAPSHPQAHYNLGLLRLREGDLAKAKRHLQRTLEAAPGHLDAIVALGVARAQTGDFEAAAESFQEALSARSDHPNARLNLANALTELGRLEEAIAHYRTLLEANPSVAAVHFHLALALTKAELLPEAIESYRAALRGDPDYADAHCNISHLLCRQGAMDEALEHVTRAARLRPDDAELVKNAAAVYTEMARSEDAVRVYEGLLAAVPADSEANLGMAVALQDAGEFSAAEAFIDGALERLTDPAARATLKCLRLRSDVSVTDEELARLDDQARGDGLAERYRTRVHLALGRLYHGRRDYAIAFEHFARGNAIKTQNTDYDPDAHDAHVDLIIDSFTPELFERCRDFGSESRRPILIVGMPRSGTTLTEQILASHSAVTGAGELPDLAYACRHELPYRTGRRAGYPECVAALTPALAADLARHYATRLAALAESTERVVDKMPENYLYLGVIQLLFPEASIVHCRREPRATALSIFFQNFSGEHPYAWNLYDIGRRYRSHQRLMAHWREVLPQPILELDYEALVAEQEETSRSLLDFCGLDWEDAVLSFHETERSVRTASTWQVRQGLYGGAVAAWRNYEDQLAPLEQGLAGAARPEEPAG